MDRRIVKRALTTRTASAVLRMAGTPYGDRVGRYVRVLDGLLHNDSGNSRSNGEAWLLSRLGDRALVVLDVGANRGSWTGMALDLLPRATVHSFEPVPETFARLSQAFEGHERVVLNEMAVSDRSGHLRMWTDTGEGERSSATAPPGDEGAEILVPCITGDDYLGRGGIGHVDLLKVDVEGHEMEVLRGFAGALAGGGIDLVQFEFTAWAAIARRWLADYYDFFAEHDFQVGKLWPRGVRWKDYAPSDEEFYRCNFVAGRRGSDTTRLVAGA